MAFQWVTLKPVVLRGLAIAAGADGRNAADDLRRRFGAVPIDEFVQQMWSALRDEWLSRDRPAATELARNLQARGVGNTSIRLNNHENRLTYLRSCRISKAVREETLPLFLAAGGSAHSRQAEAPAARPRSDTNAKRPVAERTRASDAASASNDDLGDGLRRLQPLEVPGLLATLLAAVGAGTWRDSDKADDEGDPLAMQLMLLLLSGADLVPASFGPGAVEAAAPDEQVRRGATSVAKGANRLGAQDPVVLFGVLSAVLERIDRARPDRVAPQAVFAAIDILNGAAPRPASSDDLAALLGWSFAFAARAASSESPADPAPQPARRADRSAAAGSEGRPRRQVGSERVVADIIRCVGEEEMPYVRQVDSAFVWLASSSGPTVVASGETIESRGQQVTPVMVWSEVEPLRRPTDRQLATALSELNRKDGVNAVAWTGSRVALRCGMASYPQVDGWLPTFLGVGLMASAMGANHLPAELRSAPFAGPEGVRRVPSPLVAQFGGWEVPDEDQEKFVLPSKSEIRATLRQLPVELDTRMDGEETVVRLPGPNGRLENWLGRRRGRSDDHELVVSKVTRPPWGAGVKFVLRIPCGGSEADTAALAMRANAEEWELLPSVNVWGGWSGEAGSLRLTMFLPQMLFPGTTDARLRTVANFAMYGINRANSIAVMFGLT